MEELRKLAPDDPHWAAKLPLLSVAKAGSRTMENRLPIVIRLPTVG
jgi:hypothetical protein